MKKILRSISILTFAIFIMAGCSSGNIETSIKPFPEFSVLDMDGKSVTDDIFSEHDVTIVNFWNNGCGSCIEEMPELEAYYQELKADNINFIGVGTDSCDSQESLALSKEILKEKGVSYQNLIPDKSGTFYTEFIAEIMSYPTTYVVDNKGNIIGAPITGVVKNQDKLLRERLDMAKNAK